ncbi:MAG TPA: HD domain-containing phosphohydrolase [Abditibacteriaceae bacterium]|jgi:HD-GYP domain-containing protein (c-di-GMP phosphodiesterase class II)
MSISHSSDFSSARTAMQSAVEEFARIASQELETAQREAETAREEAASLRLQLESVQQERDEIQSNLVFLEATANTLRSRVEELGNQADEWQTRAEALHNNVAELRASNNELREHNDGLQQTCASHENKIAATEAQLQAQLHRNGQLHSELLELYADLRAEDLPSLILRIAIKLTDSESGVFADSNAEHALSDVGLENMKPEVRDSIFEYARRAMENGEPIVVNDSDALPDGAGLVNLAALPVAVQGDTRGVILVANKRNAAYDDDDTELLLSIGHHAGVAMENRRLHCALGDAYVSTVAVLADAIEAKDPYTRGHCQSVSDIAVEVGKRLGWQGEELDTIRYAALLHDVGKIGVPDGILLKPGRLLPEEFSIIQRHALIGSDLVKRVPSLTHIAPVILHHHERIDGSGYPDGQSGDEIEVAARIIGIVDSFDAMTSTRPYRDPVSRVEAIEELKRCAGTQFDSKLVDIVAAVLAEHAVENETLCND